jgi:hypothetical protein
MNELSNLPTVVINHTAIAVELAATDDAIKKGLSGRLSLAPGRGMLFIFPKPATYRFWMHDMRFPIDIIWIAENSVAEIHANVSTRFDEVVPRRQSFIRWLLRRRRPLFYAPAHPIKYVLEVNAGFAAQHGIVPGNEVRFENIITSI